MTRKLVSFTFLAAACFGLLRLGLVLVEALSGYGPSFSDTFVPALLSLSVSLVGCFALLACLRSSGRTWRRRSSFGLVTLLALVALHAPILLDEAQAGALSPVIALGTAALPAAWLLLLLAASLSNYAFERTAGTGHHVS